MSSLDDDAWLDEVAAMVDPFEVEAFWSLWAGVVVVCAAEVLAEEGTGSRARTRLQKAIRRMNDEQRRRNNE